MGARKFLESNGLAYCGFLTNNGGRFYSTPANISFVPAKNTLKGHYGCKD
jgi:hypothetical protein